MIISSLSLFACNGTAYNALNVYSGQEAGEEGVEPETPEEPQYPSSFTVNLETPVGGMLEVNNAAPSFGSAVEITATPDEGMVLHKLIINKNQVTPSLQDGVYTYIISSALTNYTISAEFVSPNVTVNFAGTETAYESQDAVYDGIYGTLPTPFEEGKRFVGWQDPKGYFITSDSIVHYVGPVTLTAVFETITDADIEGFKPRAITSTYYDAQATKYGVVWHTTEEPSKPVIEVSTDKNFPEESVETFECYYREWHDLEYGLKYSIYGVVENLEYEKTYFIRMGDKALADKKDVAWSKIYEFKTRKETIESANFFFVNGTNQQYLPKYMENAGLSQTVTDSTYWSYVMKDAVARFEEADFIAHGGEMVNYTLQFGRWETMVDSVEEYLFDMPIMGTTGKREVSNQCASDNPIRESFGMMFNIDSPCVDKKSGMYYSFDYGPVHIVSIRTADLYLASRVGKNAQKMEMDDKQMAWLEQDLKAASENSNIEWIVAVMNENPLDIDHEFRDTTNGSDKDVDFQNLYQSNLIPLFNEYKVDLVLAGSPRSKALVSTMPIAYNSYRRFEYIEGVTTETVSHDGEDVVKFNIPAENKLHGTVYHQTGVAGSVYEPTGKEWDGTSGDLKPKAYGGVFKRGEAVSLHGDANVYRKLLSGNFGCIEEGKAYSMYSYVEITANTIVVRTYGVDVYAQSQLTEGADVTSTGIYLDGFMLTK